MEYIDAQATSDTSTYRVEQVAAAKPNVLDVVAVEKGEQRQVVAERVDRHNVAADFATRRLTGMPRVDLVAVCPGVATC